MSTAYPFDRALSRFPTAAVRTYIVLVAALIFTAWAAVADIAERRSALPRPPKPWRSSRTSTIVAGVAEGRSRRPGSDWLPLAGGGYRHGRRRCAPPAGCRSGDTCRRQRAVFTSRRERSQSTDGYVSLLPAARSSSRRFSSALRPRIGNAFLFIEQLVGQTTQAALAADAAKMRVLLMVSGQWQGAK